MIERKGENLRGSVSGWSALLADDSSGSSLPQSDLPKNVRVGREDEKKCLLAKFLNGFSNPTRLSILLLLSRRGKTRVGELVEELDAPQPRISDHLSRLAQCGYVKVRREGRKAYYSMADERVMQMIGLGESLLRENLDRDSSDVDSKKTCSLKE